MGLGDFPTSPINVSGVVGTLPVANGGTGVSTASANTFFAGPTSGSAAAPSFRAPVAKDIYHLGPMQGLLDIRYFGAIGNGVADDGPAIQDAIDEAVGTTGASARYGTVLFPPTNDFWNIETPLSVTLTQSGAATANSSSFRLLGSGLASPIKINVGTLADGITVTHNNMEWGNLWFTNLALFGTGAATDCRDALFIQVAPQPATAIYTDVQFCALYGSGNPFHLKGGIHVLHDVRNSGSSASVTDLVYAEEVQRLFVDGFYSYSEIMFDGVDYAGGGPVRGFFRIKPIDDAQAKTSVYIRRFDAPTHSFPYMVYTAADGGGPNIESLVIEDFRVAPTTDLILASDEIENIILRNGTVYTTDACPLANLFGGGSTNFTADNCRAFGGGSLTFAASAACDVVLRDTTLSSITNLLGTVRTESTSGVDTWRNDGITTGQTAGVVLENQTAATVGAQKFAPATARKTKGWGTTAGASESVEAWDQLQPVQATNASAALLWYLKHGGQSTPGTARMSLGEVHPSFGTLLGRTVLKLTGATANYITLGTIGLISDDAASYNGLDIGVSLSNTLAFATAGSNRAFIDSSSLRPATAAMTLGTNALPWKRLHIEGTAHVTGDWGTLTGWGTGATVSAVTGDDNHFTVTITAGTTPSANPTATLTFKDGTWTGAPWALCNLEATSDAIVVAPWTTCTTTATTLVITFHGTPVDTKTYTFRGIVLGG